VIPIVINLTTLGGMLYERSTVNIDVESSYILLITLYVFLPVLNCLLVVLVYLRAEGRLRGVGENYEAIRHFTHSL
jgi:hypothetical protein